MDNWNPPEDWEEAIRDQISAEIAKKGMTMGQLLGRQKASLWAGKGSIPTLRSLMLTLVKLGVKPSDFFIRAGM